MASSTRLFKGMTRFFIFFALFALAVPGWHAAAFALDHLDYVEYVEGEALVVLKNNITGENERTAGKLTRSLLESTAGNEYVRRTAASAGARVVRTYGALSKRTGEIFAHMKAESGETTEGMIERLTRDPNVVSAAPNFYSRLRAVPSDPYYGMALSGYSYKGQWNMQRVNLEAAWDATRGEQNVYVAVVDSGIQTDHPDLILNLDSQYSRNFNTADGSVNQDYYDVNGHGTSVAGVVGAYGNNGRGVAGVNWRTKIISLRVAGADGVAKDSAIVAAMNYLCDLIQQQDLPIVAINYSFGGWFGLSPEQMARTAQAQAYQAVNDLNRAVLVVAAGNEGLEADAPAPVGNLSGIQPGYCNYPVSLSGLSNMIVVGAVDHRNEASEYTANPKPSEGRYYGATNWSQTGVDIVAPGSSILTTVATFKTRTNQAIRLGIEEGYDFSQGTSLATPHVAGAVALLASLSPGLTASELKNRILTAANTSVNPALTSAYAFNVYGHRASARGLLDIGKIVNPSAPPFDPTPPAIDTPTPPPSGGSSSDDSGGGCSAGGGVVLLLAVGCVLTRRRHAR